MKKVLFWVLALVITLASSVFQRMTGPSHPKRYQAVISGESVGFKLPRSHSGDGDGQVSIQMPSGVEGQIVYRRFPTSEAWKKVNMEKIGDELTAALPHQPPAGKIEYRVELFEDGQAVDIPNQQNAIMRFSGSVPSWVLLLHILFIFTAMLFSNATGLYALAKIPSYKKLMAVTIVLFIIGGFIFGPVVQKYAFGDFWTGWPMGKDLTDNKVLLSLIMWIVAWFANRKSDRPWLAVTAAVVLLAIYLIPHSVAGSELDYNSGKVKTGALMMWFLIKRTAGPGTGNKMLDS